MIPRWSRGQRHVQRAALVALPSSTAHAANRHRDEAGDALAGSKVPTTLPSQATKSPGVNAQGVGAGLGALEEEDESADEDEDEGEDE